MTQKAGVYIVLGMLLLGTSAQAQERCFALADTIDSPNDVIVRLSPLRLGQRDIESPLGESGSEDVKGVTWDPDRGFLFGIEEDTLGIFDLGTGAFSPFGNVLGTGDGGGGSVRVSSVRGIAHDPLTGDLFVVSHDGGISRLFMVDPDTGTLIEDAFGPGVDYAPLPTINDETRHEDVAVDPGTGEVYTALKTNDFSFLTLINRDTGAIRSVVPLQREDVALRGIDFDPSGRLWAIGRLDGTESLFPILLPGGQIGLSLGLDSREDYHGVTCQLNTPSDLVVDIDSDQQTLMEGGEASWEVTVTNNGPSRDLLVQVNIDIPDTLTPLVVIPGSGAYIDGQNLWITEPLESEASTTVQITARVAPGTDGSILTVGARAIGLILNPDPNPENNNTDHSWFVGADAPEDSDDDGIIDLNDNCPFIPNGNQLDLDDDGDGDACDPDDDGDGVDDSDDNCPLIPNPDQADADEDEVGDLCDTPDDLDSDGVLDGADNCPLIPNPDQVDNDEDGDGDVCDGDDDNDGVDDGDDNCPLLNNPLQTDTDRDDDGDDCDDDDDDDGVLDADDNCPLTPNPDQADADGEGRGDACEDNVDPLLDADGDGLTNLLEGRLGTDPNDADSDDDGVLDGAEITPHVDSDEDGLINALDPDSDDDGLLDGTEMGVQPRDRHRDTNPAIGNLRTDEDPETTTDPVDPDTDGGGVSDGDEDTNHNGRIDEGESDPNDASDDLDEGVDPEASPEPDPEVQPDPEPDSPQPDLGQPGGPQTGCACASTPAQGPAPIHALALLVALFIGIRSRRLKS